jgi:hypothetical protein
MSDPIRMTLTKSGEAISITFTEVTRDWFMSDCKRYTITVVHSPNCQRPFAAWVRPLNDAKDRDGHKPLAENLGAFEQIKGRDGAIAACIRHKRAQPIDNTTTQQTAAAQELSP